MTVRRRDDIQGARREQVCRYRQRERFVYARKGIRATTVGEMLVLKPEMLAPVCAEVRRRLTKVLESRTSVSHEAISSVSKSMEIILPSLSVPTRLPKQPRHAVRTSVSQESFHHED